jgi:hypothetical protein
MNVIEKAAEEMRQLVEMRAVCPHITDEMLATIFDKHIITLKFIVNSDMFKGLVERRRAYWEAKQKEEIFRTDTGLPPEMWP